ncbi:MAG: hypothetical protein L6Q66_05965, partial [Bacteroidia bacterium]|nr:hypothetical protein [Bacteroidia bacterium]
MATGFNPGSYVFAGRKINTSTCSLEQAEEMYALGMPELIKVDPVALDEAGAKATQPKKGKRK